MEIGGKFELTRDEIDQTDCIDLTIADARMLIDEIDSNDELVTALDQAQAGAHLHKQPQYILLRIE